MIIASVTTPDERGRRYIRGYFLGTRKKFEEVYRERGDHVFLSQKDIMGQAALIHFIEYYKSYYLQDGRLVFDTTK